MSRKRQLRLDAFITRKNSESSLYSSNMEVTKLKHTQEPKSSLTNSSTSGNQSSKNRDIQDVTDFVMMFLKNISLPEIRSPQMPRYRLEDIARPYSRILVITEKPKVALALARALSNNFRRIKYGRLPVYMLRYGSYHVTVVPLKGHLIEYDTRGKYRSWSSIDPLEIIRNPSILVPKYRYPHIARVLRDLSRKHDLLFIATDADEEGENIGWEATQIISEVKRMPTYRLWFLSTQPHELKTAFNNPTRPIQSWALAPEARKIIDAFSGFSSTRELTSIGKKAGGLMKILLRNGILSLGRVQSPTLYLLYLRERCIRNFRPKPYWSLTAAINYMGTKIVAEHVNSPFYDYDEASTTYSRINNASKSTVRRVETKIERKKPEPPLNTNRALIMLNKILKLPASKAMRILEDLYLEGLITYPRTDTDRYPDNYDHSRNLKILAKHPSLGKYAQEILAGGCRLKRNGSKLIGDHLPITPIDIPKRHMKLSDIHIKVYELIARRYLALFMDNAVLEKNHVLLDINGETFRFNYTRIKVHGFYSVYPYGKPTTLDIIISPNSILPITEIRLQKKLTKPPERLTEAELLKYMERLGLGTKATRPEHIQKLIDRKYVVRKRNRLYVTELGYKICEFLEKIWPEFLQPYFSAYVLSLLRHIMNNEIALNDAVSDARRKFLELFIRLRKSRAELRNILSEITDINLGRRTRRK